jgi:hypothetical protein
MATEIEATRADWRALWEVATAESSRRPRVDGQAEGREIVAVTEQPSICGGHGLSATFLLRRHRDAKIYTPSKALARSSESSFRRSARLEAVAPAALNSADARVEAGSVRLTLRFFYALAV